MRKPVAILILVAPGVYACGEDPARRAVAAAIQDPGSARFQAVRERANHVCGEVNGRGPRGYIGYRRFVYDRAAETALVDPGSAAAAPKSASSGAACTKPFAYRTVDERLSCAGAPAARSEETRQRRFENAWRKACA